MVYEANINGNTVAIKFLVTEATGNSKSRKLARFVAEYFNIITISDTANIVRYVDYDLLKFKDENGDTEIPVIIMKRYECSLSKLQETNNKEEFLKIFKFLINTTAKIHEEGIIHRDIKPENILFENDHFVLGDFGIASYNPDLFKIMAETDKKERIGNRLFSAPEQENSGIKAHPTMDIYAIGQVLQWYATGATHRGTSRQRITTIFNDLEIYDRIIERCLAHQPENRFQSIDEIREYIKRSRVKDIFEYLYLFNRVCRSSFPRNEFGVVHSNEKDKIDRLLQEFKKHEKEFENSLWWLDGSGDFEFKLTQKGNGIWKFWDSEYDLTDVWVHYDASVYNDFALFHFQKGEPFDIDGKSMNYTAIVDETHHISYSEYSNGYAEIEGEIWDLSKHNVEFIDRQDKEGYFFIGTRHNCILQYQNEPLIRDFIEKLLLENRSPTIEELRDFQWHIRKHKDNEVRMRL